MVLVEGGVILIPHSPLDLRLALLLLLPIRIQSLTFHLIHRSLKGHISTDTHTGTVVVAGRAVQGEW